MDCTIRPACSSDAEGISRVIRAALRDTNVADYSETVIARLENSFLPTAVSDLLTHRLMFVALDHNAIVGTASLEDGVVRTVFVDPSLQGRGIGRALMARIVEAAVKRGVVLLAVPSSVTAEPFYAKLGFIPVRDRYHGEERTVVMERSLRHASNSETKPSQNI